MLCYISNLRAQCTAVFSWLSWNQNQSCYTGQTQQTWTTKWTTQHSKRIHVTGTERGKTRESKSWLVLVLLRRENGEIFCCCCWRITEPSEAELKQRRITFDKLLKTALLMNRFFPFFLASMKSLQASGGYKCINLIIQPLESINVRCFIGLQCMRLDNGTSSLFKGWKREWF